MNVPQERLQTTSDHVARVRPSRRVSSDHVARVFRFFDVFSVGLVAGEEDQGGSQAGDEAAACDVRATLRCDGATWGCFLVGHFRATPSLKRSVLCGHVDRCS